jgi:hypothetical protein
MVVIPARAAMTVVRVCTETEANEKELADTY